jgi:uncharacterized protein YbjT (DUF2867 family)
VDVVAVTGGAGTLGRHLVSKLEAAGPEVRVLSRRPGAGTHRVDLATGEGLRTALDGATVVVHAASDRRFGRTDPEQTRRLLAAAGHVEHLLYISIVGIDDIPYAYYRRKLECEHLIEASGVPWTILRATQFHELVAMVLRAVERWPVVALPLDARFQTVAADEVAARMVELVGAGPAGRAPDTGGPEVERLSAMLPVWRDRRGRPRHVGRLPLPGAIGRAFRDGRNTCPDHADGRQTWAEFVGALGPDG